MLPPAKNACRQLRTPPPLPAANTNCPSSCGMFSVAKALQRWPKYSDSNEASVPEPKSRRHRYTLSSTGEVTPSWLQLTMLVPLNKLATCSRESEGALAGLSEGEVYPSAACNA